MDRYARVLKRLKSMYDPEAVKGMARFGINPNNTYGVSIPNLRKIAKDLKNEDKTTFSNKNHFLAQQLWQSGIHEARILACFIDDPKRVTKKQMDEWVKDFDSWDICDQCCSNLFDKKEFAFEKAEEWSECSEEFVKRAGFAMMACLAVHDKKAGDDKFLQFLPIIKRESIDERNFVKKAVNWSLRQIGKRNISLKKAAIKTAKEIQLIDSKSAKWIAADALRELESEDVRKRCSKPI